MEIHFLYDDPTKDYHTTDTEILTGGIYPPKLGLVVVATVYDSPNEEYGNLIMGWDKYYFNIVQKSIIEYAMWNNGDSRADVWRVNNQLGGEFISRPSTRVNTFANNRIWTGALVSDTEYAATIQKAIDRAW